MKKRNWIPVIILLVCLALFIAYQIYDRSTTDTKAPVITIADMEQIPEISVADEQALLQGVTAKDDRDGDVTDSIIVERVNSISGDGQITVTYAAFDRSGNVAKAQRTMRYTDYTGPRYALTKPLIFTNGAQFDVLNFVQATDTLDGDIRHRVKTTLVSNSTLSEAGTHQILFRVTNSLGDTEELILPVEVQYAGKYEGQLYLKQYLTYLPVGASFDPENYLQNVVYRGSSTQLAYWIPDSLKLEVTGTVDTQTPGVYEIGYTVSDEGEHWSAYSKLIVVVEG